MSFFTNLLFGNNSNNVFNKVSRQINRISEPGYKEYVSGKPSILLNDSEVTIVGVDSNMLVNNISSTLDTTRLTNNMFSTSEFTVTFEEFFIPDVFLILKKTSEYKRTPKVIRKFYADLAQLLKESTWLRNVDKIYPDRLNLNRLKDIVYTLKPYQEDFINFYNKELDKLNLNGMLLSGGIGSGKTLMSLSAAHCLESSRIIIICPLNTVTRVWEDNILKVFKEPQTYWLSTSNKPLGDERFIVCHYEALNKLLDMTLRIKQTEKLCTILDECHNLNEPKTLQTQNYLKLIKALDCKNNIQMSGSPSKAGVGSEAVCLFRTIDPRFNEKAEARFSKIFTANSKDALTILADRFTKVSFKVEKVELDLTKPNNFDIKIKVPNSENFTLENISKEMKLFVVERNKYYDSRKKRRS